MIDKVKSSLTNSYLMFIFDFADPMSVNKNELSESIGFDPLELFNSQKQADRAKKVLGKMGFSKALVCYFGRFQSQEGIDFKALEKELNKHRKVFIRHLGKDKINYLNLLIQISNSCEQRRKGLLGVA